MNTSAVPKVFWFTLLFLASLSLGQAQDNTPAEPASNTSLHANDSAFDKLIPHNAEIEVIARGYRWAEGVVWRKNGQYLVFSDVSPGRLYVWKEGHGVKPFPVSTNTSKDVISMEVKRGRNLKRNRDVMRRHFGVDGVELDAQELLVLAGHTDRRITRIETNLTLTTLADKYNGKRFNSPNDLVYNSNGDLYFTDPPYGLPGQNDSAAKELPYNGVYRLSSSGEVTLLVQDLMWPNGIAFSPDEKTLYVSNADAKKAVWMAYPVKPDGTLDKGRVFYDLTSKAALDPKKGLPNGMEVDKDGNVFGTGPGGVYVFNSAGKYLGMIFLNVQATNCTFGDDGSMLYITTPHYVCRIKTSTMGVGF